MGTRVVTNRKRRERRLPQVRWSSQAAYEEQVVAISPSRHFVFVSVCVELICSDFVARPRVSSCARIPRRASLLNYASNDTSLRSFRLVFAPQSVSSSLVGGTFGEYRWRMLRFIGDSLPRRSTRAGFGEVFGFGGYDAREAFASGGLRSRKEFLRLLFVTEHVLTIKELAPAFAVDCAKASRKHMENVVLIQGL